MRTDWTRREKMIFGFIMIGITLLVFILSGCGPAHHLRKAEKHLKKAELKGADVSADTLWKTMNVPVPIVQFDTLLQRVNFRDTITVEKDKIITKIKYDTITRSMFVSSKAERDTIKIEVPVIVNRTIKAGHGFFYWFIRIGSVCLIIGFVLGAIFWAALRAWLRGLL